MAELNKRLSLSGQTETTPPNDHRRHLRQLDRQSRKHDHRRSSVQHPRLPRSCQGCTGLGSGWRGQVHGRDERVPDGDQEAQRGCEPGAIQRRSVTKTTLNDHENHRSLHRHNGERAWHGSPLRVHLRKGNVLPSGSVRDPV